LNFDFQRYLAAKKSVDDRALNRRVWGCLVDQVKGMGLQRPLRVLEIGAGIGTMLERLLGWGLAPSIDYTGIDARAENVQAATQRLPAWAQEQGYQTSLHRGEMKLSQGQVSVTARFIVEDAFAFMARETTRERYDLLIAQAFLDLVDISEAVPALMRSLVPGGLFYATLNFDGVTILEPELDPAFDAEIMARYHRDMDERDIDGKPSGDSRTGRHLFIPLMEIGEILAAGASDWVVYPRLEGYPDEEAYFLACILHFFENALQDDPDLDQARFKAWLRQRKHQIERLELVYIAHQLDILVKNLPHLA
jgi:SAM-dependent methyltransferase